MTFKTQIFDLVWLGSVIPCSSTTGFHTFHNIRMERGYCSNEEESRPWWKESCGIINILETRASSTSELISKIMVATKFPMFTSALQAAELAAEDFNRRFEQWIIVLRTPTLYVIYK